MNNNKEIITQEDSDRLIKQSMEIAKTQLERAFEKIKNHENFNRETKTKTNRG
jgi:hypothetical protein